jgi:UDPglucose--hexose-1-phosphate uridylyltransferase
MEGAGAHEVVVDTPDHDLSLIEMDEGQIVKVLNTCKERHAHFASDGRYKFILIFKNHGPEAGASLHHSHSQIIAILFVPELMLHELQDCREYRPEGGGSCAYEELVRTEGDLGLRMVIDLEHFSVHCPYASRFPFEVLIAPKKHAPSFVSIDAGEVSHQDHETRSQEICEVLDNPDYNLHIHSVPCDGLEHGYYHWHMHLAPKSVKFGSFEIGSGMYINSVPPERAAVILRNSGS